MTLLTASPAAGKGWFAPQSPIGEAGTLAEVVVFLAVVVVPLLAVVVWSRHVRRARVKRLGAREPLSPQAFFDEFYSDSGLDPISVAAAINEVSGSLEVPGGLLRPTDRFDRELAPPRGWEFDDGIADIGWCLERMAKNKRASLDLGSIRTVDDFVKAYSHLLSTTAKVDEKHRAS